MKNIRQRRRSRPSPPVCVLFYAVDSLVWRYTLVTGRGPYGTVTVERKNGKTEYHYQPPQAEGV